MQPWVGCLVGAVPFVTVIPLLSSILIWLFLSHNSFCSVIPYFSDLLLFFDFCNIWPVIFIKEFLTPLFVIVVRFFLLKKKCHERHLCSTVVSEPRLLITDLASVVVTSKPLLFRFLQFFSVVCCLIC